VEKETLKHAETVRQMYRNGLSQRQIATAIGISVSTVNRLINSTETLEGNALDAMIAQEDVRRAKRSEIHAAYRANDAERVAQLWEEYSALA
jgi:transposase